MAWLQAFVWYTRSTTQGQPARTWSTSPSEQVSLAHRLRRLSRPHRAQGAPAVLRVDEDGAVQGLVGVQDGLQHLVAHPDQLQGPVHRLFGLSGHDGRRVPHKAHPLVQDQPVVGGGLRVGLPRHGEPLLGHIPVGEDGRDAGDLHGGGCVDLLNEGVGRGGCAAP